MSQTIYNSIVFIRYFLEFFTFLIKFIETFFTCLKLGPVVLVTRAQQTIKKKKNNGNIISNVFEFNPINSACQSWDYVNLKMFKRSHKQ